MRNLRFAADEMLGRLAKWLRIAGYDTAYWKDIDDARLVELARAEGRLILTRDTSLVGRLAPGTFLFLKDEVPFKQFIQAVNELGLDIYAERIFTVCTICNAPLEEADRESVEALVPEYTFAASESFRRCGSCGRVYWHGTHRERVLKRLKDIGVVVR